jgi:hypothetical protein
VAVEEASAGLGSVDLVVVGWAGEHGRAKRARAQSAAAEGRLEALDAPVQHDHVGAGARAKIEFLD